MVCVASWEGGGRGLREIHGMGALGWDCMAVRTTKSGRAVSLRSVTRPACTHRIKAHVLRVPPSTHPNGAGGDGVCLLSGCPLRQVFWPRTWGSL